MKKRIFSSRGITMIEIMIGLVIIGITASMAVPRFQIAIDRMNFRSVNRDVISKLRTARSRAISEKKDFGVYFDGATTTYILFEKAGTDPEAYEPFSDVVVSVDTFTIASAGSSDYFYFASDSTVVSEKAVVFSPNGSASWGGMVITFSVTEDVVAACVMDILAATGRISTDIYTW